ncbi:hypothetical protein [Polynucleobacter necessarius]|uniref:hypothetical protein n=1 Tax=Polynucleobacter necessarius TaxID=576610 RepID=UPI0018D5787B|nr:hypothetical protein [Polynucleobacter necessarius]
MKFTAQALFAVISCVFLGQAFAAGKIQMNEYMVQSDTPGISLYVRTFSRHEEVFS